MTSSEVRSPVISNSSEMASSNDTVTASKVMPVSIAAFASLTDRRAALTLARWRSFERIPSLGLSASVPAREAIAWISSSLPSPVAADINIILSTYDFILLMSS